MMIISRRSIMTTFSGAFVALVLPSRAQAETDPHMRAALEALETAHNELRLASPDERGERRKAKKLVRRAIGTVQSRIRLDNLQ
ncbi:MAG: hypothetical protein WAV20_03990 [Blastocatellia bacterium]